MSATRNDQLRLRLIAGMPRAATTWLCRCLNEHPDVAAFGETLFWGRGFVQPHGSMHGRYTPEQVTAILDRLKAGQSIVSAIGPGPGSLANVSRENLPTVLDEARAELPKTPTPAELFLGVCNAIARWEKKGYVVEKTPHHLNWLDRIMESIPDVKVVVMLREPYSFMLSYKHQGDRKRDSVRKEFERRYHPLACALVWRSCMKVARDAITRYPKQVLIVKNEEIRRDAAAVLDQVQEFYDLPRMVSGSDLSNRVPPENTSFPTEPGKAPIRPDLRGDDVFWMNLVAARTLRAAGYDRRSVPREPLRIAWSILRLPIWAAWNFISMKRVVRGSLLLYLWRWVHSPSRRTASRSGVQKLSTRS